MTIINRGCVAACMSLGVVLAWAPGAGAQEFDVSVNAGATYTDNVRRVPAGEEPDTTANIGLQMRLARDEGRLQSNIAADLQYRSYLDDTYDDELVGGLNGTVTYWFSPDRFSWVVQNSFGQALTDARAVDTPGNRQNTNYFSTGPDFILRLGDSTDLSVQARWSDASYEESDTDNQRLTATMGLIRRLSDRASVSLNGTAERVEYDQSPPNSDFDRQSWFVGYEASGARTTISLQAGYTALHDFGETIDGPMVNLSLSRELSARSTLTLNAGTNLTDSADAFRRYQGIGSVTLDTQNAVISRDPFQSDYVSVAWALRADRNSAQLSVDWRQEDHERDDAFNRDSFGAGLTLTRRMTQALSGSLYGNWRSEDFDVSGVDFDEWSVGLGLDWNFARQFTLTLRGDHFDGSGGTSFGNGIRDYEENRVSLMVSYSLGRR